LVIALCQASVEWFLGRNELRLHCMLFLLRVTSMLNAVVVIVVIVVIVVVVVVVVVVAVYTFT
jgi:hypothetical protein